MRSAFRGLRAPTHRKHNNSISSPTFPCAFILTRLLRLERVSVLSERRTTFRIQFSLRSSSFKLFDSQNDMLVDKHSPIAAVGTSNVLDTPHHEAFTSNCNLQQSHVLSNQMSRKTAYDGRGGCSFAVVCKCAFLHPKNLPTTRLIAAALQACSIGEL